MTESGPDVSLNISYMAIRATKKKKGRFFGNKNYRNPTRSLYIGKRKGALRKVLNTSSVQPKSFKLSTNSNESDGVNVGSTALHFTAFESADTKSAIRKKKLTGKRIEKKEINPNKTSKDSKTNTTTDKIEITAKLRVGPWKSSLFNQNPEIPKVHQAEVSKISEEVFSSKNFSDLSLHPHLVSCVLEKLGLKHMTFIQQESIPILLTRKDAFIKSQTGSGKTLAYALPIVQVLQEEKPEITRESGPVALVLTPTRELALQSYKVFATLTQPFCRIVPSWIIGGENRKSEKSRIRKGVNIIIGTPGRVVDHIQTTKNFSLANIRHMIFDEADRLLDMGFQSQIEMILEELKSKCERKIQTILLSATLSDKVECLASLALENPVKIQVTNSFEDEKQEDADSLFAQPENLEQHVAIVPSKLRLVSLVMFLRAKLTNAKMIVFLSCRDSVEFHYRLFKRILRLPDIDAGLQLDGDIDFDGIGLDILISQLHGGMTQVERQNVFNTFSSSESGVLLTTDVAARGLDLPSVSWVVQYTSPGSPIDYIHRVGRTARAGKKGNTILMLTPAEVKYVKLLTQYNIKVHEMSVDDILTSGRGTSKKTKANPILWQRIVEQSKSEATHLQNQIEYIIAKDTKTKTLSRTAYMSYIRAYASYASDLKTIFHVKNLHLGHVAKSFGLRDAPSDIVKTLEKTMRQLPIRTSFEYRHAKLASQANNSEHSEKPDKPEELSEQAQTPGGSGSSTLGEKEAMRPPGQMSRKQIMRKRMHRKPDLMSEFSSGLENPSKRAKIV